MSEAYSKYEADGWFYLSRMRSSYGHSGDLGTGNAQHLTRFQSDEGRAYFIQAEQAREAHAATARELEWLKESLRESVKKRNVRKRILELIGA